MGRRSDHSRDEIKRLALDAAWRIAEEEGYRGLTVRNIASQIGYVPGTLYNVFDNIDDIIFQLRGETLDALHESLLESAKRTARPEVALQSMARAYIGFVGGHLKLWNVMFEHLWPSDRPPPDWYHQKANDLLQLVEDVLAPLFPTRGRKTLERHAQIIWAGVQGICAVQLTGKAVIKKDSAELMSDTLISNYLRGLSGGAELSQRNDSPKKRKASAVKTKKAG